MVRVSVVYRIAMVNFPAVSATPVSFGERLASSGTFDTLFREGMALVERTAAYLDGDGREQAQQLGRTAALAYASESMRLTTRLMQIASWLLLQRAVNEGEMSGAEAAADKRRTRVAWQAGPAASPEADQIPPTLKALIENSLDLQGRIQRLDAMICGPFAPSTAPSALDAQRALLRRAFSTR